MELSTELQQVALTFGQSLRDSAAAQAYFAACAEAEGDEELAALENEVETLFEKLNSRQMAGEALTRQEVDGFYALRDSAHNHPAALKRESAADRLKTFCASVLPLLNNELGFDYTSLVVSSGCGGGCGDGGGSCGDGGCCH